MQDDNLEHMEYLLTKEALEIWLLTESKLVIEWWDFVHFSEHLKKGIIDIYLKEHGLPLDREIKDL